MLWENRGLTPIILTPIISTELGYKPAETFESGIRKTIQWYLDNKNWWRSIMDGSYQKWIEKNYD